MNIEEEEKGLLPFQTKLNERIKNDKTRLSFCFTEYPSPEMFGTNIFRCR